MHSSNDQALSKSKVIFLDIDGVLNSQRSCFNDDLSTYCRFGYIGTNELARFHKLLEDTNAKVVLISSWANPRDKNREAEISEVLNIEVHDTIASTGGGRQRGYHVMDYVNEHNLKHWVVIEDSIQHYVYEMDYHFVNVNGLIGLTHYDCELAKNILE